jgi:phosphate/sulfate permease
MTINSTTSLKWSAILFAALWTVGMVWWSASVQPVNVIILAMCGVLAAYFWYLGMRWFFQRARLSSAAGEGADDRETSRGRLHAWLVWAALMVSTGLATALLHGLADPYIPAGDWHNVFSGLFVIVVWPALAWSLRPLLKRHLPA